MSETRKSLVSDGILGLMITVLVFLMGQGRGHAPLHNLCDGTFVAAVVLLGSGGIRFCTSRGALDMLGYGFKTVGEFFIKAGRLDGPDEDYYEYCQRKAQERKPFGHYLIVGLVFLVLSAVLLAIHSMFGA